MSFANLTQAVAPAIKIMWQGMAGIFVVMSAISFIVFLLTKVMNKK